ncbi:MAG: nitroreductase family protein, partial [Paracoccaceae bacterium]
PWQLIVLSHAETNRLRDRFAAVDAATPNPDVTFPERYVGAYKMRRSECGWQLYDAVGVEKGDRVASEQQTMENYRFFGAPHVAFVTSPAALGAYGILDCGAFVTGFMLAAQALGLASIAQAALAGHASLVRDALKVPEDRQILCGISFGYSDTAHPANSFRTTRAAVDEVMDWREA